MSQNNRISYIDVAKGILILLVVFDHLPDVYMYLLRQSNNYIYYLDNAQWTFKLFFMPAFFCITGMCSNFNRDFKSFLISNFKLLIVPNILLGIIVNLNVRWGAIIVHGGYYWFLSSLFVAKLCYWMINRLLLNRQIVRLVILVLFVFIGFSLNGIPAKYDFWYFHYAFSLSVFLEIGRIIKKYEVRPFLRFLPAIYFLICILIILFDIHKPIVAMGSDCVIGDIPLYLLSATSGTCLILFVSKWINRNRVLQFFGRKSIVFYIFQINLMFILETAYLSFFKVEAWLTVALFVSFIYLVTVIVLSIISLVLDYKYCSFLIGKF